MKIPLCLLLCVMLLSTRTTAAEYADWAAFLGGVDSSQYSALDQIDRSNVSRLVEAWRYEFPGNGQSIGNPLVIARRMYIPWSGGVLALDAETGGLLWSHNAPGVRMRGLATWTEVGSETRYLYYHRDDHLHAIDAATGSPITDFGSEGRVNLKLGLDRDPATIRRVESQSPGRVYGNLIIVGSTGGSAWNGPPGYIRAYHARTGELIWTFHSIPHPGEPNFGGWLEDAWKTVGGVNNWTGMSLDAESGTLFVPFAAPNHNFFGGNRHGDNLYANSLVALDAASGRYLWHFQTVHHDLWDYDLPQAPKLLDLEREGKHIKAVAVAGKTGFVYTFDRLSGAPVFHIEEREVPLTDVPGERVSPTQPFPTAPPPFARQAFGDEDLSRLLPSDEYASLRQTLSSARNEGLFTPPSRQGSIAMPGTSGGANWGGGVADTRLGRLYLVSHEVPSLLRLQRPSNRGRDVMFVAEMTPGAALYHQHCSSCHGETMRGQAPTIPSLANLSKRLTVEAVKEIVSAGRGPMPGLRLTTEDMRALLEFLGYERGPALPAGDDAEAVAVQTASGDADSPVQYESGYNFLFSRQGLPANSMPWSQLTALDLNAGTILWQVPYGGLPGLSDSGAIFPKGAIAGTAGGLLFAGTQDRKFRAWHTDTGAVLLEADLPSLPGGVPAIYAVGGRQYIAVPAASYDPAIAALTPEGVMPAGRNSLVVFALPPGS